MDLGCGTGILTVTLARRQRTVVGIDPDDGMLQVARDRDGTEGVRWVLGDSREIGDARADLLLMTGNVVQQIGPGDWHRTLHDIRAGLGPGGTVSFETRNPAAEAWRQWASEAPGHSRETANGRLTEWMDVTDPDEHGTVGMTAHNLFENTGEDVVITFALTFRSLDLVTADLAAAGLSVVNVRGGWHEEQFEQNSRIMVIEAQTE